MSSTISPDFHVVVTSNVMFVHSDGTATLLKRLPTKKIAPNVITPVGGHLELGESPEECVRREVKEELGIEIDSKKLSLIAITYEHYLKQNELWISHYFAYALDVNAMKITTDEGSLVTSDQFVETELYPRFVSVYNQWKKAGDTGKAELLSFVL